MIRYTLIVEELTELDVGVVRRKQLDGFVVDFDSSHRTTEIVDSIRDVTVGLVPGDPVSDDPEPLGAIPVHASKNFDTLMKAAEAGDLALLQTRLVEPILPQPVQAVVGIGFDGEMYAATPFAILLPGNPFEMLSGMEVDDGDD